MIIVKKERDFRSDMSTKDFFLRAKKGGLLLKLK